MSCAADFRRSAIEAAAVQISAMASTHLPAAAAIRLPPITASPLPAAPPLRPGSLHVGGRALIHGVVIRPAYNGKSCSLLKMLEDGRWEIHVDGEARNRFIAASHLQPFPEVEPASITVEIAPTSVAEDVQRQRPGSPVYSSESDCGEGSADGYNTDGEPLDPERRLCYCGAPAVVRVVRKHGPSQGRSFVCPPGSHRCCHFFRWLDY